MRRKEERSKQGQTNNKAKQHSIPKAVTFPKKNELPRVGHIKANEALHTCVHVHVTVQLIAVLEREACLGRDSNPNSWSRTGPEGMSMR